MLKTIYVWTRDTRDSISGPEMTSLGLSLKSRSCAERRFLFVVSRWFHKSRTSLAQHYFTVARMGQAWCTCSWLTALERAAGPKAFEQTYFYVLYAHFILWDKRRNAYFIIGYNVRSNYGFDGVSS